MVGLRRGRGKKGIGCLNSGILSQAACGRLVLLTNLPQKDKFFFFFFFFLDT